MSPQSYDLNNQVSGVRKAAILLMGMGEPVSGNVIRQLDPDEIRLISNEIASLEAVAPQQMITVFREFESLSASGRFFARGGPERARRLIEQAIGEQEAQKLFETTPASAEILRRPDSDAPFSGIEPGELAKVLADENPQTLALVLSNLPAEQAGPLMESLSSEIQPQVALRIALMDRVPGEVFNEIAAAVRSKLKASRQILRSNGTRALAAILNHMDGEKAELVLSTLEPENMPTVASVRQLMFIFDDIVNLEKESVKALIGRIDRKVLTVALKGTSDKIKFHFTQNMSQRSAEMLTEDMEALGPVRIRDVSAAQQQIIALIRQLEKEGVIASGAGGGDDYVV
jgi:flagellar motor switch protein FliG